MQAIKPIGQPMDALTQGLIGVTILVVDRIDVVVESKSFRQVDTSFPLLIPP